jgi:predicted GNAT superfamily acetyltransferase
VTVVVDRGMAYEENLAAIRAQGYHYLVASRQPERNAWLAEFDHEDDWSRGTLLRERYANYTLVSVRKRC